jgi:hypothetical protein
MDIILPYFLIIDNPIFKEEITIHFNVNLIDV